MKTEEITLNNGTTVVMEEVKSSEGTYYKTDGLGWSFSSLESAKSYLNESTNSGETDDNQGDSDDNDSGIDYSLSEDNNSLDDTLYDSNGNDTNGHYDDDGDYWADGHSEYNCD